MVSTLGMNQIQVHSMTGTTEQQFGKDRDGVMRRITLQTRAQLLCLVLQEPIDSQLNS